MNNYVGERNDQVLSEEHEDDTKKKIVYTLENSLDLLEHHPISRDIEWILERFLKNNKIQGIASKKNIKSQRVN